MTCGGKRGGGGTEKGEMTGPVECGWKIEELAPDCEFLSVESVDEPLVETPFPGQSTTSLSSLTLGFSSSLIITSSFTLKGGKVGSSSCTSALVDLASVFWLLRSLDSGRPRLTVSMSW